MMPVQSAQSRMGDPFVVCNSGIKPGPRLIFPLDGGRFGGDDAELLWQDVGRSYRVTVSTDPGFTSGVVVDDSVSASSYRISIGLDPGRIYYWRIKPYGSCPTMDYSETWSFTTSPYYHITPLVYDADANSYPTVKVDTLQWFASNLKTTKYANGDIIQNITQLATWEGLSTGAWIHHGNNANLDSPHGKLYNGYAVLDQRNICPAGWRVSTTSDWQNLLSAIGSQAASKLLARDGDWDVVKTNESGMSIYPSGRTNGAFMDYFNEAAFLWTSSRQGTYSNHNVVIYDGSSSLEWETYDLIAGYSVRCVRRYESADLDAPIIPESVQILNHTNSGTTLSWSTSDVFDSFEWVASSDEWFQDGSEIRIHLIDSVLRLDHIKLQSLESNVTYYWRVRANRSIDHSEWSEVASFSLSNPEITAPITVPLSPNLIQTTSIVFTWHPTEGADSYEIGLRSFDDPEDEIFYATTDTTIRIPGDVFAGNSLQVEWRVRGVNGEGPGPWANGESFYILDDVAVSASWQGNATSGTPVDLMFEISPNQDIPSFYSLSMVLEVDSDADFVSDGFSAGDAWSESAIQLAKGIGTQRLDIGLSQTDGTSAHVVRDDEPAGLFRVRLVKPTAGPMNVTIRDAVVLNQWGDTLRVRWEVGQVDVIEPPPLTPGPVTLLQPADNSTDVPLLPTFVWSASEHSASYAFQLGTDSDFTSSIVSAETLTDTTLTLTTPLNYATTYFWRVRGESDADVEGVWSDTLRFTTLDMPIPSILTPVDGALNVPLEVDFSWSLVEGAHGYDIQIAKNSQFDDPVLDGTVHFSQSSGRFTGESYTTYWIRVRALIGGQPRSWSAPVRFETVVTPPVQVFPNNGSTGISTAPTLNWLKSSPRARTQVQVSNSSGFGQIFVDQIVDETTFPLQGLVADAVYYWRIRHIGEDGVVPSSFLSRSFRTRPFQNTVSVNQNVALPSDPTGTADYRMIGLPGLDNIRVSEFLPGSPGIDYRLFRDNGAPTDFLNEYTGTEPWFFEMAKGYWIFSKRPISVDFPITLPAPNSQDAVAVNLQPGWNIITNPFLQDVMWADVQSINDLTQPLFAFNGSYSQSDRMRAFNGYYVHNPGSSILTLYVPYSNASMRSKTADTDTTNRTKATNEHVTLLARFQSDTDTVQSRLTLTRSEVANYVAHPSLDFAEMGAVLVPSDEVSAAGTYRITESEPGLQNEGWRDVHIRNQTHAKVDVSCSVVGFEAPESCILIHLETGQVVDLNSGGQPLRLRDGRYRWVFGSVGFAESVMDQALPTRFQLSPAFPNPFNPMTSIRFAIPESGSVTIAVYDVLGREVTRLLDQMMDRGWHQVRFDAASMASGVYLIRTTYAGESRVMRVTLLK